MPDPKSHAEHRGALEDLLSRIPGFRGYLEKEYRRDSDALQRQYLADRLQKSKSGLDEFARSLADRGQIDEIPACDRLRGGIDKLIAQIRGAMQGYSGMFDLVKIDEQVLERVYESDAALASRVEVLADGIEHLSADSAPATALPPLVEQLKAIDTAWNQRHQILKGLA